MIYIAQLLDQVDAWIKNLQELLNDINQNPQQYNSYLQVKIPRFLSQLTQYKNHLSQVSTLESLPTDEVAEACANIGKINLQLNNMYEKIMALSHTFCIDKTMFTYGSKNNTWSVVEQNNKWRLLRILNKNMIKIEILASEPSEKLTVLVASLSSALQSMPQLDYIDLSGNQLDDVAMQFLANTIEDDNYQIRLPKNLEVLILSKNHISSEGLEILLTAFVTCPLERHVLLDHNRIDFDNIFFNHTLVPKVPHTHLVNLDLTMNFISKGYMFYKDNIRLYYYKNVMEMKLKFPDRGLNPAMRTYIAEYLSNPDNCLRSMSAEKAQSIISLIASIDPRNTEREIDFKFGMIGLFAKKTIFPWTGEHAYIMVEGISKFGQRYLVRGDLYTPNGNVVSIRISQCSPQDFLRFISNREEFVHCKTGRFEYEIIQQVLKKMCSSRSQQGFYSYSIRPNTDGNGVNCLTWATQNILRGIIPNIEGWIPSITVRGTSPACRIL